VVDARRLRAIAVVDTGPVTNHVNFVTTRDAALAYVTVGGLNQTKVFRRGGSSPQLVATIPNSGAAPHGLWPSPDNSRVYVGLENADAVDVIDTSTQTVVSTLGVGQQPQALVYVAGAVPSGDGTEGLERQGLDRRRLNLAVPVRGSQAPASAVVRETNNVDMIDISARNLTPGAPYTAFAGDGTRFVPLLDVVANPAGGAQALGFTRFFDVYDRVILVPRGERP